MWESSIPLNNDNSNSTFVTTNDFNAQLINSYGRTSSENVHFQTCRPILSRFRSHSSDDDQILSDEDEDNQEQMMPQTSRKRGPHSFVFQVNVRDIHIVANAPPVTDYVTKMIYAIEFYIFVPFLSNRL